MEEFKYGVIIGVYQGVENVDTILNAISKQTIKPKQVIVWVNKNPAKLGDWNKIEKKFPGVEVIVANKNYGCFGRFTASYLLKTKYVMVFDDDTVPGDMWAENCSNTFDVKGDCILGARGIRIKPTNFEQEVFGFNDDTRDIEEVDFVGHSWVFPRKFTHYMFDEQPVYANNGEDIQLSAMAKISANIKSYTPPQPADNKRLHGSVHPSLGLQPGRLCSSRPQTHYTDRTQIIKHWISRGWTLKYKR